MKIRGGATGGAVPPRVRAISTKYITIDGLSQCSYIPQPPRWSYGRPLAGKNIFLGTAVGIPFSFTRAIRAGSFWRQNSFQADILSILVQIVRKSLFVCLKMASKVPTEAEEVS